MPQLVEIELSGFLSDLAPRAIRNGVPAPLGYHVDALLDRVREHLHEYWPITPNDLLAAIVFDANPDIEELGRMIVSYKRAKVWEVRTRLGEPTEHSGTWPVPIRGRGER